LKGQSEIISTVIILGAAVTIALALVYFLGPMVAGSRAHHQVVNYLAQLSAGLESSIIYSTSSSSTTNTTQLLLITISGTRLPDETALYIYVIGRDPDTDRVLDPSTTPYNYTVYSLGTLDYSLVLSSTDFNTVLNELSSRWNLLSRLTIDSSDIYILEDDGNLYRLSELSTINTTSIYILGLAPIGYTELYALVLTGPSDVVYEAVISTIINGEFYPVAQHIVASE